MDFPGAYHPYDRGREAFGVPGGWLVSVSRIKKSAFLPLPNSLRWDLFVDQGGQGGKMFMMRRKIHRLLVLGPTNIH